MKENFGEDNITLEDKEKMDDLLSEAKGIINDDAEEKKYNPGDEFSPEEIEEIGANLEKINERLLDDKSDFLTNTEKGKGFEIFYRTLIEEIPELGLSIDENAETPRGEPLSNHIAIKTTPFKTDRHFINDLDENPIIDLFVNRAHSVEDKEKIGIRLEEDSLLPKGTTSRLLSRDYKYYIKAYPTIKKTLEKDYAKFKNAEPLSDKEIKEFLRKVIKEEYLKKL